MVTFSDKSHARQTNEARLTRSHTTFQETFLILNQIGEFARSFPEHCTETTVASLVQVLESGRFDRQRQRFFLYQACCDSLITLIQAGESRLRPLALTHLQALLLRTGSQKRRAISQAFGRLPLKIHPPASPEIRPQIFTTSFDRLAGIMAVEQPEMMVWQGRSLIGRSSGNRMAVIKFLRQDDRVEEICLEPFWMTVLKDLPFAGDLRFRIPVPIMIDESWIFSLHDVPSDPVSGETLHPDRLAIAFLAHDRYFDYPNSPDTDTRPDTIRDTFRRNAAIAGLLAARGIIHTALIPLFHNRAQQHRREDRGVYLWEHGGRLDQWLESCRYPNFGASGLRDFEHFDVLSTPARFHHYIGTHILSFILVAGSHFRNREPHLRGTDESGHPVDARHLFDRELFFQILSGCIQSYYKGLTGNDLPGFHSLITMAFIDTLIEKMGIDQDMEERLRIEDQLQMDPGTFNSFIRTRIPGKNRQGELIQGKEDIVFSSGPHLGGFNQPISVPELTDLLFVISALCIAGRYAAENGLNPLPN